MTRRWAVAAWVLTASALALRAGRYPAAMTGDEIWFAEAAFHLLREGLPRRPLHAGAAGSEILDFLPPLVAVLQAGGFALFGIGQWTIGLPSLLVPLAIAALAARVMRDRAATGPVAALAALATLATPALLKGALYVRYEGVQAALFLGALLLVQRRSWRARATAGALLALAGVAYYPTAPAVGLAALALAPNWRRLGPVAIGFAAPSLAFVAWVAQAPNLFVAQILATGEQSYVAAEFDFWRRHPDGAVTMASLAAAAAVGLVRGGDARRLALAILATSAPALVLPFETRLLALPTALAVILLATALPWRLFRGGVLLAAPFATALFLGLAMTAMWQWRGRDLAPVTAALARLIDHPGTIAIDQRAWLALRPREPDRPLLQVTPASAPPRALVWEPSALRDATAAPPAFVVLDHASRDATIARSPMLAAAFAAGRYAAIGRIAPPFAPLPWAAIPPYDLVVYALRP
jgi:hypothetical protein